MRASGILMHITSLPGPYGIGTLGKNAYAFVDFLKKAGQTYWQLLPLNPTGFGDSPYQSCSSFAGNPYLIDFDILVQEGLLQPGEADAFHWGDSSVRVDFGLQYKNRMNLLRIAFERFTNIGALDRFCNENSSWLADFTLYMALKDRFAGLPWYRWEDGLKFRDPEALRQARQSMQSEIRVYSFVQYLFYKQWNDLRTYARNKGVRIIGDVPIYVPLDSVEVWCNPALFQLDETLTPTAVAGCPPDYFSEDGQLWGNPLYRWDDMKKDGYSWWVRRLGAAGKLYDVVRLDHFRGFESYWSVPYGDGTARNGKWVKGPDLDFVESIKAALPNLDFIAEDLGFLTPEVLKMRDDSGFPGMRVLQFAFDSREPNEYLPHTYIENTVCYTGTHDNMTQSQWFDSATEDAVSYAAEYMCLSRKEGYVWGAIRTAMSSVSRLCVIPVQDYLELGGEARMNFPGTMGNNWVWRAVEGCFNDTLAERIYGMTALYGRLGNK
ncbi:MAG: 4-alpha-glucanotransferase [Oscillospiraceae bacterium]|nr:4-alpha-glucanotransferase [Oscillospiraceae bacterium]